MLHHSVSPKIYRLSPFYVWFVKNFLKLFIPSRLTYFIRIIFKREINAHKGLIMNKLNYSRLSLFRLRLSRITAYLEEIIWSLFKHTNLTSGNKLLLIRGDIAHQEQFLPFPTIFSIYISNLRGPITYSFVKCDCAICIFLNSENLICRSTDILKCFRGSLQLRDNESRLLVNLVPVFVCCVYD